MNTLTAAFQDLTGSTFDAPVEVEGEASFESSLVDVIEVGNELDIDQRNLGELENIATGLESYQEALQVSSENAGMDENSARWALTTGQAILAPLNTSFNSVSTESFGNPSDAQAATETVSLEAKEMWNKIVEAIKKLIDKIRVGIKKLWVKLTDSAGRLAKRGEALSKKAAETKGTPKEKTFEASFVSKVHLGGKAPSGSAFVSGIQKLDDHAKNQFEKSDSQIKAAADNYSKLVEQAASGDKFESEAFVRLLGSTMPGLSKSSGHGHLTNAGGTVYTSEELLGGKVLFQVVPASGASVQDAVKQAKVGLGEATAKKPSIDDKVSVDVLSTTEVGKVGDLVKTIGQRMSSFKSKFEARDKLKDKIKSALEKAEKKATSNEGDMSTEQKQGAQAAMSAARKVSEQLDNPVSDYARYLMTTLATAVAWGEKSLSMHSDKED